MATAEALYNPPINAQAVNDYYRARAFTLLGAGDTRLATWRFFDFDEGEANLQRSLSTSGVLRQVNNRIGGWYEVDSGATAGSVPQAVLGSATGGIQIAYLPSGTAGVWYMAIRLVRATALSTAQTDLGMRAVDRATITAQRALLGKINGFANWAFKADGGGGATIDSGISASADSTAHVLEAVRVGGATALYVDEVLVGSSDTFPTTFSAISVFSTNGTDATSRSMLVDWVAVGALGRPSS